LSYVGKSTPASEAILADPFIVNVRQRAAILKATDGDLNDSVRNSIRPKLSANQSPFMDLIPCEMTKGVMVLASRYVKANMLIPWKFRELINQFANGKYLVFHALYFTFENLLLKYKEPPPKKTAPC